MPVPADSIQLWKDSHPNFQSFEIGQKVIQKIPRIGNKLVDKLERKYSGPYTISKVQSNGVSYEITDANGNTFKVHHQQLRLWREIPQYLKELLPRSDSNFTDEHKISDSSDSDSIIFFPCNFSTDDDHNSVTQISQEQSSNVKRVRNKKRIFQPHSINELSLDSFRCSGQNKNDSSGDESPKMCDTCTVRDVLLDWSFDSDVIHIMSDDENVRVSSPIADSKSVVTLNLSDKFSSIGVNTSNHVSVGDSEDSFLAWLEQSLIAQESLLASVSIFNDARIELDDCLADNIDSGDYNEMVNTIRDASDHTMYMQNSLLSYRNASFNDNVWQTRFEPATENAIVAESSDIVLNLSSDITDRWTRSKGKVTEYPNVQRRTLEYKHGRNKD